tara:strand:- start:249 stop:1373 length:1125 start_codon:yes stop_codon:yes gene_type:complete
MMGALVVVVVIFMVFSRPELINKLGSYSILFYRVSFSSEAKNVLGQLAHQKTGNAVKLLQDPKWTNVLLDDKPYYLKREVLKNLCSVFHRNKNYKQLLHWATVWRDLDERDVDAMAFWYEALRHTTDRRKIGVNGLSKGQKQFLRNVLFQRFYFQSQNNSGKSLTQNLAISDKQKLIIQRALKGWELRWRWKLRHVLAEPVGELQQHFMNQNWGEAWSALIRMVQIVKLWAIDESIDEKGYVVFSIDPDKDDWMHVSAVIPRQMSTLRVDLPPFSSAIISELNLTIDGILKSLSNDWFEYVNLVVDQDSIKAKGFEDSHFILNMSSLDRLGDDRVMKINIRFKLSVIDLFGNSNNLSHKIVRDALAKNEPKAGE